MNFNVQSLHDVELDDVVVPRQFATTNEKSRRNLAIDDPSGEGSHTTPNLILMVSWRYQGTTRKNEPAGQLSRFSYERERDALPFSLSLLSLYTAEPKHAFVRHYVGI